MADMETIKFKQNAKIYLTAEEMGTISVIMKRAAKRTFDQVEEEEAAPPPVAEDWACEGLLWENPPRPCPKGTSDKYNIKDGCKYDGKRHVVCRMCKNALSRLRRAKKKKLAEAETKNE